MGGGAGETEEAVQKDLRQRAGQQKQGGEQRPEEQQQRGAGRVGTLALAGEEPQR